MSRKSDLMDIFKNVTEVANEARQKIEEVDGYRHMSDFGKQKKKDELKAYYAEKMRELNEEAQKILYSASAALQNKWHENTVGRFKDAAYQQALSNTLTMIELKAVKPESFGEIINYFAGDFNALETIRNKISASGNNEHTKAELLQCIPADTRHYTLQMHGEIAKAIDKYITEAFVTTDSSRMGFYINNKYLFSTLNDDLMVE